MGPELPAGLSETVARLRRTYLTKLPQVLVDARAASAMLAKDAADDRTLDSLHRAFHNLKGTAASLGLPGIAEIGAVAVDLLAGLQRQSAASRRTTLAVTLEQVGEFISRLEGMEPDIVAPLSPAVVTRRPSLAMIPRSTCVPVRAVFLHDDNATEGQRLADQLSCFGYAVATFTDIQALGEMVHRTPPDAMVISSSAVNTAAVLEGLGHIPKIFVSEQADFPTRLRAVQAGGDAYFIKPPVPSDLVETLDSLISRGEPEPFRVLIVDDEPEIASYHALILEEAGMITRLLDQPQDIIEVLSEFKPDLVLMDIYMPGCSGRDLSRLVRQIPQFVSMPIIFLSSETNKSVQVSAMRTGGDGFLTKPIQPEDLVTAVTVRAERMRTLRTLMIKDSLTGLLNHTTIAQFLGTAVAAAERQQGELCFAMIDIDLFKRVNDTYGHPAGDQVLVALARLLRQRLRNSDMVGRYGGEEFAVILQDVSLVAAVGIIEQIRRDFAALVFSAGENRFSCSLSSGIAAFPDFNAVEHLVQSADQALYQAKRNGRDRVVAARAHTNPEDWQ